MNKAIYIKEINNQLEMFDTKKLRQLFDFVKFLRYQDLLDPSAEIISNEEWLRKTKTGIEEMKNGELIVWDSIK